MSQHAPVLIVLLPLTAALLCLLFSRISKNLGSWMVIASIFGSFTCAVHMLQRVLAAKGEAVHYWFGGWAPPIGIEFSLDPINSILLVVVTFISLMVSIYSRPFVKEEDWLHIGGYYTLFGLLTVGLCGMIATGDVFNLYVFLEIMSLAGYGLIAMGGKKSMLAAFRYLLIGTIGASLYLLGVAYLYALTGTLNMADMAMRIGGHLNSPLFALAVACFIIGLGIKMALFPLHGWQPDAYTFAHPGAAAFIAGVMSKAPSYALIRFLYYVFKVDNLVVESALNILGIMGIAGILIGSIMALAQYDFRRMLAYSSVAQIGYIAIGLAMGNMYGFIGAVLHIVNHAFMKSALFLVIGGIEYRFGEVNLYRLGGMNKKLTISTITVTLAALSMIGLPPTAGFFSKWYLLLGAYTGAQYFYIAVLVVSSLLNAIYFFRIIEQMFIQREASLSEVHPHKGKLGLPLEMVLPIMVGGIAVVALGFYSVDIVAEIIKMGLPEVFLR
ncbi:MAG: monovalent cation/H+ antiporter subunit D family protein [Acidaminococcaceae bacterium]|nr:monovalent cation/H+ antiporter subunit D family protein [Acidaminococcaceae bacterium]